MKRGVTPAVSLILLSLVAGCTSEDEVAPTRIQGAYPDATKRFLGIVADQETTTKSFSVECDTPSLIVKVIYDIRGTASFILSDPDGMVVMSTNVSKGRFLAEDAWFYTTSPKPGTWSFKAEIRRGGSYAFGFYYEETLENLTLAFEDAPVRITDEVPCGGSRTAERDFYIECGVPGLVVKTQYDVRGTGNFSLAREVHGDLEPVKWTNVSKARQITQEIWHEAVFPEAGPWIFNADVREGGKYAFGFYYAPFDLDSATRVTAEEIAGAFPDAKLRVLDTGSCGKSADTSFEIPPGTLRLTVKAIFFSQAGATLHLSSQGGVPCYNADCPTVECSSYPDGVYSFTKKEEDVKAGTESRSDDWFSAENPNSGCWGLHVKPKGFSRYAFGFYF